MQPRTTQLGERLFHPKTLRGQFKLTLLAFPLVVLVTQTRVLSHFSYSEYSSASPNFEIWGPSGGLRSRKMSLSDSSPVAPVVQRPRLVIHMGPGRTGSASLQLELSRVADALLEDHYHYEGRNNLKGRGKKQPDESDIWLSLHSLFEGTDCAETPKPKCVAPLKLALEEYRRNGHNVIVSDESIALNWKKTEYFQTLADAMGKDWEVILVAGYRPVYDWFPSMFYNENRMDVDAPWNTKWPSKTGVGKAVEPIFSKVKTWRDDFTWVTQIQETVDGALPVRLINMNDYTPTSSGSNHRSSTSLRTKLLCHIMTDAPTACRKSYMHDRVRSEAIEYKQDPTTVAAIHYDMIATAAAAHGMIDREKFSRASVRSAIQDHVENELQKSTLDLSLSCPHPKELENFLKDSIHAEIEAFDAEGGVFSADAARREVHKAEFDQKASTKVYCSPKTDAILQQAPWKKFFEQFAKESSTA